MKIRKIIPFTLSLLLLTSCGTDTVQPPPIDLSQMEQLEKTLNSDLPFYNAAELYETEAVNFDPEIRNIYTPDCFDGGKLYYFGGGYDTWHDEIITAEIYTHDVRTGEEEVIYKETVGSNEGIWYDGAGIYDNVMYWYRTVLKDYERQNTELYRMDLNDRVPQRVVGFNSYLTNVSDPATVRSGNMLYLDDYGFKSTDSPSIYRIDMESGKAILFRRDASTPLAWKNGMIYLHDGGFYYNGPDKIPQSGIFYEEDELLFRIEELCDTEENTLCSFYSDGKRLYYQYIGNNYPQWSNPTGYICEYDPNREEKVVCLASNDDYYQGLANPRAITGCKNLIWFGDKSSLNDVMLVYDTANAVFGAVTIGCKGMASENEILIYNLNLDYSLDSSSETETMNFWYVIDGAGMILKP